MLQFPLVFVFQVAEMCLSHDIQMRQARPWRPRHRPCLFSFPPAFHLEILLPNFVDNPNQDAGANLDTFLGILSYEIPRYGDTYFTILLQSSFFFQQSGEALVIVAPTKLQHCLSPSFGKAICILFIYISAI